MEKTGKRFKGKVVIVTASTQGIGFAIAHRLGFEGASVVISSRKQVPSFLSFPCMYVPYEYDHNSVISTNLFVSGV